MVLFGFVSLIFNPFLEITCGDDAAEGFPGGPRDPSVLTSFAEHVAHAVWSGQVF